MGLCEKEALFRRENVNIDNICTEKGRKTSFIVQNIAIGYHLVDYFHSLSAILDILTEIIAVNNEKGCSNTTILKTFCIFALCDTK